MFSDRLEAAREKKRAKNNRHFVHLLEKYSDRRQRLLEAGKLSLPSHEGCHMVIVSPAADYNSSLTPEQQKTVFLTEGERIAEELTRLKRFGGVTLTRTVNDTEFGMAIKDPEVSDITLIGHGSISALMMPQGVSYDWQDVARAANTNLKQGVFMQRTCGNVYKRRVPLATFMMADMTNYYGAIGVSVPEEHPSDELFVPLYTEATVAAHGLVTLMNQHLKEDARINL